MAGIPPDWRDTPPGWPQIAYRFDPEARSVQEVTAAEWHAAEGPVHKRPYTETSCHGAVNQEVLKSAGRRKAGHGQYAITSDCDRSGVLIALLSADGPNPALSIPFLGGGKGYRGQHYHEVLTYADLSPVGKPIPIPLKWSVDATMMAWSPDSRFVIYRYKSRPDAVIVPVPEREPAAP
jgi:hypothetical protein